MKIISAFLTVLLVLLAFSGSEKGVAGQCEGALYGGGCVTGKCNADCKSRYGSSAYGYCFFYQKPDDTCVCRHPC